MSRAYCCFWLALLASVPWALDSAPFSAYVAAAYDLGRYPFPHDPQAAMRWYRRAATRGDAAAAYSLGTMYFTGDGTIPDPRAAAAWWRRAAESGDVDGQRAMGDAYCLAIGVHPDSGEARRWWTLSARQGNRQATASLRSTDCTGRVPGGRAHIGSA